MKNLTDIAKYILPGGIVAFVFGLITLNVGRIGPEFWLFTALAGAFFAYLIERRISASAKLNAEHLPEENDGLIAVSMALRAVWRYGLPGFPNSIMCEVILPELLWGRLGTLQIIALSLGLASINGFWLWLTRGMTGKLRD